MVLGDPELNQRAQTVGAAFPRRPRSHSLTDTRPELLTSVDVGQRQGGDVVQAGVPGSEEGLLLGHHLSGRQKEKRPR